MTWQPIETAPGNVGGLVWVEDAGPHNRQIAFGGMRETKVNGETYRFAWAEGYSGDWKITHWMPLPAPPNPQQEERG